MTGDRAPRHKYTVEENVEMLLSFVEALDCAKWMKKKHPSDTEVLGIT